MLRRLTIASTAFRALRAVVRSILHLIPPKTAGLIEYEIGYYKNFSPFEGPMNGQTARLEIARSLIEKCHIEQIIETGTFRGQTTEWFAQFNLPVFSAEIQPRLASFAQRRMVARKNVQIENMDSVSALRQWCGQAEIVSRRTLFYLDAHWGEFLPLRDELNLIASKFSQWLIIVDDFKVPFDDGYNFDDYGPGRVLDLEYLKRCNIGNAAIFFPSIRAEWETSIRRGCVILASGEELVERCRESQHLRPFHLTQ